MANYQPKTAKSILNKLKYIDSWFWCRYTLNPYTGCEHACIYCDGRSDRYYTQADFEETIYYKENAQELLENQLKNAKLTSKDVIGFGGTCDAYQPLEITQKITQSLLQVILKYKYPIFLITKSTLVERDLSILNAIGQAAGCTIAFTITSADPKVVSFLEPNAAPSEQRFELIKKIKAQYPNIQVGITFMPIIPLLEDGEDNLEKIVKKAAEIKADFILFGPGVTLRDRQGEFFYNKLKQYDENLYNQFRQFWNNISSNSSYFININQKINILCNEYQIPIRAKRWIPNDFRYRNYMIAEKLLAQAYRLQIENKYNGDFQWAGLELGNLTIDVAQAMRQGIFPSQKNRTERISQYLQTFIKEIPNVYIPKTQQSSLEKFAKKSG
jgi:DNA repair photolyase